MRFQKIHLLKNLSNSQKLVNPLFYVSSYFLFGIPFFKTIVGISINTKKQFPRFLNLISGGFLPFSPALLSNLQSLNGVNCTQELGLHGVKAGRIAMVAVHDLSFHEFQFESKHFAKWQKKYEFWVFFHEICCLHANITVDFTNL